VKGRARLTLVNFVPCCCRPKALILHLKRFVSVESTDYFKTGDGENRSTTSTFRFEKNETPVEFSDRLSLESHEVVDADSEEYQHYELKSLVHHVGRRVSSGHYETDAIRCFTDGGETIEKWVEYDDSSIRMTNFDAIQGSISKQKSVYMLLYTLDG
jgi:ubiquitin C-terminal hydrolase